MKLIVLFSLRLLRGLSYLIPKKSGMLVFQQRHNQNQFSGNIKALVLYAHKNYKNGSIYVVSDSKTLYHEVASYRIPVIGNKILSYWYILRAEFLVIDSTISKYTGWNLKIIQLWHGTGFKNIGLLQDSIIKDRYKFLKFKKHYSQYKLVVATSEDDQKRKQGSFGISNVVVTGSPRNDVFFEEESYFETLKNKYEIASFDKIISYTPTFRDFKTSAPFTDSFWSRLNDHLVSTNFLFIIKKHPWDKYLEVPKEYSNIRDLSKVCVDVQELLLITDLLISDYSGIITDFAITNRPILLYVYDWDIYLKTCRSMYYNIENILPRPFVQHEEELLERIIGNDWFNTPQAQQNYKQFRNKFHKYLDGNSSERVMNEIVRIQNQ